MLKKNKLRYNEYYDMQKVYDELYAAREKQHGSILMSFMCF